MVSRTKAISVHPDHYKQSSRVPLTTITPRRHRWGTGSIRVKSAIGTRPIYQKGAATDRGHPGHRGCI